MFPEAFCKFLRTLPQDRIFWKIVISLVAGIILMILSIIVELQGVK